MAEYTGYLNKVPPLGLYKMRDDMLWQFKDKPNIDALIKVFARQFNDLYEVFVQLETLRWLNKAAGVQLDHIGEIVVLSRVQAAKLEEMRLNTRIGIIDDEIYRMWLKYKMFLNTFDGTYKDFMRNISMFWEETVLYYSESPEHPATIILDTPELEGIFNPEELFNIPVIKPGGVQLIIRANTKTDIEPLELNIDVVSAVCMTDTHMCEMSTEHNTKANLPLVGYTSGMITESSLSEMIM